MKRLLIGLFLLISTDIYAQGTGTPFQIRVRIDSNGALVISSAGTATQPFTNVVFGNARLKVDADGNLVVACDDCGGGPVAAGDITPGTFQGTDAANFKIDQVGTDAADTVEFTGDRGSDSYNFRDGLATDSTFRIYFNSTIQYNGSGSIRANHAISDLFLLIANNGFTASDSLSFRLATNSVTGVKAIPLTESNFTYLSGDTDGQTFTLPDNPTVLGSLYRLIVTQTQASNSMSIAPPSGETLRDGTSNCSTLTATAIGAVVDIQTTATGSGGHFTVVNKLGTWTCNP